MNIATSLNHKYMRYTYVSFTSILVNNPAPIDFYILHRDLTEDDIRQLTSLVESYDCHAHFITIDPEEFRKSFVATTESWPLESFFRLQLASVLPDNVDRLLYLDVDIIVDKSLDSLYHQDFEGCNFIVCREITFNGSFSDYRQEIFAPLLDQGYQYFNAGVMLWNIKQLRDQNYNFESYLSYAAKLSRQLIAFDQDLLNLVHHDEVKYTDEYLYDLFPRYAYSLGIHYDDVKNETVIVHFTGEKPWQGQYIHYDIEQLWWDYAKLTPFYQELMEEFMASCLSSSFVYDIVKNQQNEILKIQDFLNRFSK